MAAGSLKTGIVLSGGGARGAYEVGVLSYLRDELERERPLPLEIICGTSVGAIHACFLAAMAHEPREQGRRLIEFWRGLSLENMLNFGYRELFSLGRELFFSPKPGAVPRQVGLVRPLWLERELIRGIPWRRIGRNLEDGNLSALSITATHVGTGRSVVFVHQKGDAPTWSGLDRVTSRIGPKHALASAAIPLLFPPVTVRGRLYVDGGLRTSVPLSPALRLGAQRVLVLSVRHGNGRASPIVPLAEERSYGTAPSLIGKTLNALFLDPTEQDLARLRQVNELLEAGTRAHGRSFGQTLNVALPAGAQPLRYVRELEIAPSADIGGMAASHARSPAFLKKNRGLAGRVIRQLADRESPYEADLVSYLLFDGDFADQLIELGRADARARRLDWERFWAEGPQTEIEWAQAEEGEGLRKAEGG
ncbi:MAG: patatin-like phospholipase family protein [Myxococcales bacterium]